MATTLTFKPVAHDFVVGPRLWMHEIHPKLLGLGHALDIREPRPLFDAGIAAVVDVAFEEPPAQLPRQLVDCRFPINDGGNDPSILLHAVQCTVNLLATGTPTITLGAVIPGWIWAHTMVDRLRLSLSKTYLVTCAAWGTVVASALFAPFIADRMLSRP